MEEVSTTLRPFRVESSGTLTACVVALGDLFRELSFER